MVSKNKITLRPFLIFQFFPFRMFRNFLILCAVLLCLILVSLVVNLNTGFSDLSFSDFWSQENFHQEIISIRANRTLAVLLAGISIPTSGFLLQEYFKNPLAGPSVLGISSAASLSVAFYILASKDFIIPEFIQHSLISIFAICGSIILLIFLLIFSKNFKDSSYIIIFGFLVSALAGAVISILQFYDENESLKRYILWSFGGNNQVSFSQNLVLAVLVSLGLIITFKAIKPLIGMSLGEDYARTFGVNLTQLKFTIIIASSLLSASITAFLGPVLFIGVIVPHFCRMIWNPAQLWHQWILNILIGALIMELFSIISEIWQMPLNIISSLFGIPVIFLMMMKKR